MVLILIGLLFAGSMIIAASAKKKSSTTPTVPESPTSSGQGVITIDEGVVTLLD